MTIRQMHPQADALTPLPEIQEEMLIAAFRQVAKTRLYKSAFLDEKGMDSMSFRDIQDEIETVFQYYAEAALRAIRTARKREQVFMQDFYSPGPPENVRLWRFVSTLMIAKQKALYASEGHAKTQLLQSIQKIASRVNNRVKREL